MLTPYRLDPKTLNQNIIGSYLKPWNQTKYSGKDGYFYKPSNFAEIPAYIHDKVYDKIGVKGGSGLLTDLEYRIGIFATPKAIIYYLKYLFNKK